MIAALLIAVDCPLPERGCQNAGMPRTVITFGTFDVFHVGHLRVIERAAALGDRLVVGDELAVRLPGPWDGPVRVVEVTETSFRLATLRGHMEAGEIGFRADTNDRGWTAFEIESWARSGDGMFYWLYERFPLARELQLHMWAPVSYTHLTLPTIYSV